MKALSTKQKMLWLAALRNSMFARLLYWPVGTFRRWYSMKAYQRSNEGERVRRLKGIHEGERCFVIGNGPSLLPQDLDKLQGEVTFAANRIFCIFDRTAWRPTYYCCFDYEAATDEIDRIKASGDYPKFLCYRAARFGRRPEDNIIYLAHYGKYHVSLRKSDVETLSEDVSKYATFVASVTINAIELAIYMGFKEIYLLGVDHNYMLKVDEKGRIRRDDTVKANYFPGVQDSKGNKGVGYAVMNPEYATQSYRIAKRFAEAHGVKIYNATRGGKLEVFERVDFDELFDASPK